MLFFAVLLLAIFSYGQGQSQKCVHGNTDMLKADTIINQVLNDLDTNNDRKITDLELLMEIVGRFDANDDSTISKDEFVNKWHQLYKDIPDFAAYLFCHFDMTGDSVLNLYDVPQLKAKVDIDIDGVVSDLEFDIFMTHLYMDCVPHAHYNGKTC